MLTRYRINARYFYPRSPCGERPPNRRPCPHSKKFLSTLSLRRATKLQDGRNGQNIISIHALLAESDRKPSIQVQHPLNFYPRSPCGERRFFLTPEGHKTLISIHALLAESDHPDIHLHDAVCLFLSTLSLRRATAKVHKTVGHFCTYETNFMGIASSY